MVSAVEDLQLPNLGAVAASLLISAVLRIQSNNVIYLPEMPCLLKNDAQGKEILDLQRATKFIPTQAANYAAIEAAARSASLLK